MQNIFRKKFKMELTPKMIMITIRNYTGTIDELVLNTGNMHYDVTLLVLKKNCSQHCK